MTKKECLKVTTFGEKINRSTTLNLKSPLGVIAHFLMDRIYGDRLTLFLQRVLHSTPMIPKESHNYECCYSIKLA